MRDLSLILYGRTKISGRSGWDKRKGTFVPKKADIEAIRDAMKTCVKNKSMCPSCNKVIDFRLGALKSGDDGHIPNNKQAPSCDRIENHGKEYIFYNGVNNIRITHRKCNTDRRDEDDWDFSCENPEWIPTLADTKEIQIRNEEIVENNFFIEITNTDNTSMKTNTNTNRIKMLTFGMRAVACLNFTLDEVEASLREAIGGKTQSASKNADGAPNKKDDAMYNMMDALRKSGVVGDQPFQLKKISAAAAELYGRDKEYFGKLVAIGAKKNLLVRVGHGEYKFA